MSFTEKRRHPRRQYRFEQLVADYDGSQQPNQGDFYPVTFLNISRGGAAFLSTRKPTTQSLVLLLGKASTYVLAKVVRVFYRTDVSATPFEVACKFVRRLR